MINRYRNAAAVLQVKIVTEAQVPVLSTLKNLPKDRLIMQFIREPNHFMIVTFVPSNTLGIRIRFKVVTRFPGNKLSSLEIDPISIVAETPVPAFYESVYKGDVDVETEEGMEYNDGKLRLPITEILMASMERGEIDITEPRKVCR